MIGGIAAAMILFAPAPFADERRMSAAEVERILDAAALKREAPAARPVAKDPAPARPIEGEVGVSIGSGGTREMFGTAVVPVGAEGVAILSIDSDLSNRHRSRRRR